ncbi:thiamine-monophosphate kinase [Persephonella hydrogeniphila]|uniref:Thiamine-monophosphate kinase n=1 Tax=Persephonella hydrogeniphila TaxID=198703 RepID=A0A285N0R3_9AQUI|nr:thiamine-phosphate kinase [Persephonella hydrogeniphila]SNZ03054.1 thiamine-monophosphate kinase [Persephonella hydrogeniphila]
MKIKDLGEFGLIDRLTSILQVSDSSVVVGFGDDCSCVNINGELILFTSDIQLEGKHFLKEKIEPEDLGWKLISINVSDIVSCGGVPKWGFISVGFPPDTEFKYVEKIYRGMKDACDFYKTEIIGGNTTASDMVLLDLYLTGKTDRFVGRKGAKKGDYLILSGYTGLSRAGLELLLMNKKNYEDFEKRLIKAHTRPKARIDLSQKIMNYANSCIDVSDGLIGDLGHVERSSSVKIVLRKENLPVHPDLRLFCKKYSKDPFEYILYGGEDYELVFTVSKENINYFDNCFVIGSVEEGEGIFLKDGISTKKLEEKGFEHI